MPGKGRTTVVIRKQVGALNPDGSYAVGTTQAKISGVLDVNTTTFSSPADTVENDAITYTLPANTLNTDGKMLRIEVFGTLGVNANAKTVRLYLGSTELSADESTTQSGKVWRMNATVIRTGVGTQKSIYSASVSTADFQDRYFSITEDETTALVVKVTAQSAIGDAADIVVEGMITELLN